MTSILLIATNNPHKVREIGQILERLMQTADSALPDSAFRIPHSAFELRSGADFPHLEPPEETGATFEANALIKARAYAAATGLLTLADDSGLVVDALDGRPGVLSARYASSGEAANARVLEELRGVPDVQRGARFECVMALADATGAAITERGTVEGRITHAPRGAAGFGYDPIFELTAGEHAGKTTAEISAEAKNALSHRGRALAAIAPHVLRALAAGKIENL